MKKICPTQEEIAIDASLISIQQDMKLSFQNALYKLPKCQPLSDEFQFYWDIIEGYKDYCERNEA